MIPELTSADRLSMSLSQINRYEKKFTKLLYNNRYYLQYYDYDVSLHDWSIRVDDDGFIIAEGNLENGNSWKTSGIIDFVSNGNHYRCTTENGSVYRLYFDSKQ